MENVYSHKEILDWIADIEKTFERRPVASSPTRLAKRKHDGRQLPSPPRSLDTAEIMSVTTPKRRKTGIETDDMTPRAPRTDIDDMSLASFPSRSDASGRTSPRKQLASLAVEPKGLKVLAINSKDDRLPASALQLLKRMTEIASNHRAIDAALADRLPDLEALVADDERGLLQPSVFGSASESIILGRLNQQEQRKATSRLLDTVVETVRDAESCQNDQQDENSWNNLVHTPMLKAAFSLWSQDCDVGFTPCTTADLIREYQIDGITGSKVDYCMFLDPCRRPLVIGEASSEQERKRTKIHDAIEKLRRGSEKHVTINHTKFPPLQKRPIFLSIETKRYGGDQEKANLQLGIWLSSQWRLLQRQLNTVQSQSDTMQRDSRLGLQNAFQMEDESRFATRNDDLIQTSPSMIPFLPAIVVDGHYWKLALSTYKDGGTILWASRLFGSTETILGALKIIQGLSELVRWGKGEYGDWYVANILDSVAGS